MQCTPPHSNVTNLEPSEAAEFFPLVRRLPYLALGIAAPLKQILALHLSVSDLVRLGLAALAGPLSLIPLGGGIGTDDDRGIQRPYDQMVDDQHGLGRARGGA